MTPEIQNILNRLQTLETQNTSQDIQSLQKQINDLNFKAYGREGLKNLKKTWTVIVDPILPGGADDGVYAEKNGHRTVKLVDGSTKSCYFNFIRPRDLSPLFYEIIWASAAASGNAYGNLTVCGASKNEADNVRTATSGNIPVVTGGADILNFAEASYISGVMDTTLFKKDDMLSIKMQRLGGDGNDTLAQDVYIYGLKITYV